MAEELQNLLERIQKDGVQKAEEESEKILARAREKAATLLKDAEKNAAAATEKAEQDAEQFMARSKKTLEQAARDVILSVGDAVTSTMKGIAAHASRNVRGLHKWVLYRTNSAGFRGPEYEIPKPPELFRTVIIGDSYTMGSGVEEEFTYAREVERALSQRVRHGRHRII